MTPESQRPGHADGSFRRERQPIKESNFDKAFRRAKELHAADSRKTTHGLGSYEVLFLRDNTSFIYRVQTTTDPDMYTGTHAVTLPFLDDDVPGGISYAIYYLDDGYLKVNSIHFQTQQLTKTLDETFGPIETVKDAGGIEVEQIPEVRCILKIIMAMRIFYRSMLQ
jgi:hypothetical protein